ncbi:hypothetical protein FRT59_16755 [Pseudomonas haemolytica]|uniref:Uncharacterized protein n=1 Tax=Pseudomonas haemolytica TaxID=2600065 RepID=A0A5P1DG50_9PSED|nr:hypothetical protein [Pseudomonas haemolytica]
MPIIPPQRLAQHLLPHKNTLDMRLLIREEHRTCFDHRKSEKELGLSFRSLVHGPRRIIKNPRSKDLELLV